MLFRSDGIHPASVEKSDIRNFKLLTTVASSTAIRRAVRDLRLTFTSIPEVPVDPRRIAHFKELLASFYLVKEVEIRIPHDEARATIVADAMALRVPLCAPLDTLRLLISATETTSTPLARVLVANPSVTELAIYVDDGSHRMAPLAWALHPSPPPTFHLQDLDIETSHLRQADLDFLTSSSPSSLHRLSIYSDAAHMSSSLSFARLTGLQALRLNVKNIIDLDMATFDLVRMPNLQEFHLSASQISSADTIRLIHALPPSITTISVPQPTYADTLHVINSHRLPNLQRLALCTRRSHTWSPWQQIVVAAACRASGFHLRTPEPADLGRLEKSRAERAEERRTRWGRAPRTLGSMGWQVVELCAT